MQRFTNKQAMSLCVGPLHKWIHAKPESRQERVACLRSLGRLSDDDGEESGGDDDGEMDDSRLCQSLVVEALLKYSKGKEGNKLKPYGDKAGELTSSFQSVPTTFFATTLASMYPFIVTEKRLWPALMKIAQYPIPQLWPKTVVKRYMHFQDVFHRQHDTLFEVYEADGGEYHGEPPESSNDEADEEKQPDIELDCDLDF